MPDAEVGPITQEGWTVHSERLLYASDWVSLGLADVEAPDGHRVREHHVVRAPLAAAGAVVWVGGRVLLLWRHRFVTRSSGWEIPAGRLEQGETAEQAAIRETLEESGYVIDKLAPLASWHPAPGMVGQTFHAFVATAAAYAGLPAHTHEAERIEWLPLAQVAAAVDDGLVTDGLALVALLAFLRRTGA